MISTKIIFRISGDRMNLYAFCNRMYAREEEVRFMTLMLPANAIGDDSNLVNAMTRVLEFKADGKCQHADGDKDLEFNTLQDCFKVIEALIKFGFQIHDVNMTP